MKKVYLDAVELSEREIINVIMDEDVEVISAGATIQAMEVAFKEDYTHIAAHYDLHFIFDDAIPSIDFYTVPQVDIVATDSLGGFIGSIGQGFDIESDAPICYMNKDLEAFILAENGRSFLENIASWKKNRKPYHKITFYRSKAEAERDLEFVDLPQEPIGEKFE